MNPRRLKKKTVRQLANQAGLGFDDALVTLWEAGLEYLLSPDHAINPHELQKAEKALCIVEGKKIDTLLYWEELLGCTREELAEILVRFDLSINRESRKVPKGGISKLKLEARKRGIDPFTGRIRKIDSVPQIQTTILEDPLQWQNQGHEYRDLYYLTAEEVKKIHYELVKDFAETKDPISPPGERDKNLLESAVSRPRTALGNVLKYPTVEMAAAALLHSIIMNHAFHNGNKRTAFVSMLVMMDKNGVMMTCDEDEVFRMLLSIAQHRVVALHSSDMADREVLEITRWLCKQTRLIDKSERPIPWRRLKSILQAFGCIIESTRRGGRGINISREYQEKKFVLFTEKKILNAHILFGDYDGRDVQTSTIKKIREELLLDEKNGVDSQIFYGDEPEQPRDFIAKYRKTLNRLAKF